MSSHDADYYDYSAQDANQHFYKLLEYFFINTRNPYRYSLAKKHFNEIEDAQGSPSTKKLFQIITGTNLVGTKMVLQYRTPSNDLRYKIKRTYQQLVDRYHRLHKRQHDTNQPSATSTLSNPSSKSHSFAILSSPDTDESDTDSNEDDTNQDAVIPTTTPDPTTAPPVDDNTSNKFTEQASILEKNMDETLADIAKESSSSNITLSPDIQEYIKNLITVHVKSAQDETTKRMDSIKDSCSFLVTEVQAQRNLITQNYESINDRINQWEDKVENLITDCVQLNDTFNDFQQNIPPPSPAISLQDVTTLNNTMSNLHSQVNDIHVKLKTRISKLRQATNTIFRQQEDEYSMLYDRVYKLEEDFAQLKRSTRNPTKQKLQFDSSSESEDSQSPQIPTSVPISNINAYGTTFPPRTPPPYKPNPLEPDMEYLRKNINITCTEQDQILEFYIKLRLAVAKGGIYLRPIDTIVKDQSIAQNTLNKEAHQSQSNALYTILANEKYIPKTFTMAQNCILGYSTSMDGFSALKAMLKLTHPVLNKKRPTPNPPTLSDSTDIHNYEQNLRNYYLLHRLYNKTEYPSIDQSKQFLRGIEDDKYSDAVKRIQNQLDTTEMMQIPLPDDFTLDNIASSIINITDEYDDEHTAIVRAANSAPYRRQSSPHDNRTRLSRPHSHTRSASSTNNQRFSKVQCNACKFFGHTITHCSLLPKVLAINQYQSSNKSQCETILRKHISQNSVSSKKTFVRALQQAQVLPEAEDSDDLMDNELVVNVLQDNDIQLEDADHTSE